MSCEPFITTINTHHIYHKRQWFQASDSVYSGRISSIPDGYHLFRTDSVHSERMQDIRGVSGEFIAFHMHLYSSAVFPVLDKTRHQFTSIPHIDFHSAKSHILASVAHAKHVVPAGSNHGTSRLPSIPPSASSLVAPRQGSHIHDRLKNKQSRIYCTAWRSVFS